MGGKMKEEGFKRFLIKKLVVLFAVVVAWFIVSAGVRSNVYAEAEEYQDITAVDSGLGMYLESDHPYATGKNQRWEISRPGAQSIAITFSEDTSFYATNDAGDEGDTLTIYDKNDKVILSYSGKGFAGRTITVHGDTIRLQVDAEYGTDYGFKIIDIEENVNKSIYRGYCGKYSEYKSLAWIYDAITKELVISGSGEMAQYNWWGPWPRSVEKVVMKDGVKTIGSFAFSYCENLTEVIIPESLTAIDEMAFDNCRSLREIVIPNGVVTIGYSAFSWCSSLQEIIIPESVTTIGGSAFALCSSLTEIIIPKNVESIKAGTFKSCDNLKKITILNPVCGLGVPESIMVSDLILQGYTGSTTEKYADLYGFNFVALDSDACRHKNTQIQGAVTATCITEGYKGDIYCLDCDEVISEGEVIAAKGHGDTQVQGKISATCTAAGYTGDIYCLDCNELISEGKIIAAKGHGDTHVKDRVTATCTVTGYTGDTYCLDCDKSISAGKAIAAKGHGDTYIKNRVTATCTAAGYTGDNYCQDCDELVSKGKTVVLKEHTPKVSTTKATASKDGKVETKCTQCSKILSTTAIPRIKSVTLSASNYTYNGKVKKPTVTVKGSKGKTLKKGTDYEVTYPSGRKNPGKYTVTVKFKGNYSGTTKKTFTIKPKAASISKVTASKKGFKVSWKKQTTQVTGYQIQYSTNKKFAKNNKTATISKNSTTSKKIMKLTANKKYYVRIRTYKTVKISGKNTKIYSNWSSAKTVTAKK